MLADRVEVITRRPDYAARDTLVLEFSSGVHGRPILREARKCEQLIDGGTVVRLKLMKNPDEKGGLLYRSHDHPAFSLSELCRQTCPAVDVDLFVSEHSGEKIVIGANDWSSIAPAELLSRMPPSVFSEECTEEDLAFFRERVAPNLRLLRDDKGGLFGRACIAPGSYRPRARQANLDGVLTVGGLRATEMRGILGILVGSPTRASRDSARPSVPRQVLKRWAEEQVELIPHVWSDIDDQVECAGHVRVLGGQTKALPVALFRGRWWSADELSAIIDLPQEILIADNYIESKLELLDNYQIFDNVLLTSSSGIMTILQDSSRGWGDFWPVYPAEEDSIWGKHWWTKHTLDGAVIEALAMAWGNPVEAVLAASDLEGERQVAIGRAGEQEIKTPIVKICRPGAGASK